MDGTVATSDAPASFHGTLRPLAVLPGDEVRFYEYRDDTVFTSPVPAGFRRVVRATRVDGAVIFYRVQYELPSPDTIEDLRRRWVEEHHRYRPVLDLQGHMDKRARVPASSDDAIKGLREARAGDEGMPEECAVCLQDFNANAGEKLRVMPCSHAFHPDCIFTWLRVKPICPMCRQALPMPTQQQHTDQDSDSSDEDDDTDSDEDAAHEVSTPAAVPHVEES